MVVSFFAGTNLMQNTDMTSWGRDDNKTWFTPGYDFQLAANRQITHAFGVSLQYQIGKSRQQLLNHTLTETKYQAITVFGDVNLSNLLRRTNNRTELKLALHGYAGAGILAYDARRGTFGAGGENLVGNSDFRELITKKNGTLFKSSQPDGSSRFGNDGDDVIIDHLKEGYNKGKAIELYGYSRGGAAAIRITNKLGELGINVSKLITFDAHNLFSPFDFGIRGGGSHELKYNNVGMAVNFYQHNFHMGMFNNPFFGGKLTSKNINVGNHNLTYYPVDHNNIIDYVLTHFNYGL